MGMNPEEIALEYPHLTLAQVHAALAYSHANREEIESDIAQEERAAAHWEQQLKKRPDSTVSRPRLYVDEDAMRRTLVFALRARNVDVLTALEADMINRGDEDHLAAATASGRVLYSYNLADYCILHQGLVPPRRDYRCNSSVIRPVKNYAA